MSQEPLRVLIVDDSALFRMLLRDTLAEIPDVSIVGHAADGQAALDQIAKLDPDAITLDVEMPGMDGLETLRAMRTRGDRARAIMVSRHTTEGATVTTDALLDGAFDFVLKPSGRDIAANKRRLREALAQKLAAVSAAIERTGTADGSETPSPVSEAVSRSTACELVLIGSSTGGPDALRQILPRLPANLPAPILVVQHMPPQYTASLASRLDELCELSVSEAGDGTAVEAGRVLIAPGGRHTGLARRGGRLVTTLTDDPPEHNCRPSVDYLFRSAFEVASDVRMLGVVLTGMGSDGTEGCALLKDCGGRVLAQHARGCAVYGMSKSVIEQGLADRVLSLPHIAAAIRAEVTPNE